MAAAVGGVAILTAGIGFFVGRDTGLLAAVKGVKMKGGGMQDDIAPSDNKPK